MLRLRMLRTLSSWLLIVLCLVLLPMGRAEAQLEPSSPLDELDPAQEGEESADEQVDEEPEPERPGRRGDRRRGQDEEQPEEPAPEQPEQGSTLKESGKGAAATPAPPKEPRQPPPPILAPRVKDGDLLAAWQKWSRAHAALDSAAAAKAQQELLTLRQEVGASDMDTFSLGFLRAAEARRRAQDESGAMQLTEAAVALAPQFPYARVALAEALARRDPGDFSRYSAELKGALASLVRSPRYLRPALADIATSVLAALLATATVVVVVLFLRRVRYLLHDFHHLLPRAVARWQSATLGLLLLSMPVVFRLGLVPVLLVLLLSVSLYLPLRERLLAAILVVLMGLVPLAAGRLASYTAFAGTAAEDVLLLESGSLGAEGAAERVRFRKESGANVTFAELFALGRYEVRRGLLPEAIEHFKAASEMRTRHAALLTNWGNTLFASGNESGAVQLYTDATQSDPSLAAPYYNLFHAYRRRAMLASDEDLQRENAQSSEALSTAQRLDRELLTREPPKDDRLLLNTLLLSPPLPREDLPAPQGNEALAERVEAQLARALIGTNTGMVGAALAGGFALLAFLFGLLATRFSVARECEQCGRSVCRRCDKDLGLGSKMCAQCVNAFARKGAVTPQVRVLKQLQITRYRAWMGRISFTLGALVSGAGHLFTGLPLRGALYAFLFLLAVCGVLFHRGVLRVPYGELPVYLKLVPLALLLIPLHLLTLRGLYRRQSD
jgi:tetratricopeptide (TPR) repeat protein